MKLAVCIVSPAGYLHSEAFREVAQSVHHGLLRLGHDSMLTQRVELPGRRSIVFGANLAAKEKLPLPADAILFNLEQIQKGSAWVEEGMLQLLREHPVWDYSAQNARALEALGVQGARVVPIGFVPELQRISDAPVETDVLFVGSVNERRRKVLDALAQRGLKVERLFGVYGAQRDARIARAAIVLNLHYYDAKVFEIVRVSYLLANRRFVVSEVGSDAAQEQPFAKGVAFAPYDSLVETCVKYAQAPDDRARIAAEGQRIMTARPMEASLAAALAGLS